MSLLVSNTDYDSLDDSISTSFPAHARKSVDKRFASVFRGAKNTSVNTDIKNKNAKTSRTRQTAQNEELLLNRETGETEGGDDRCWYREKKQRFKCFCGGVRLSKWQFITLNCSVCLLLNLAIILILLYAIVPLLIRNAVSGSQLDFSNIVITNPQNSSVNLFALGVISNAGPFQATIDAMTLNVQQILPDSSVNPLGSISLGQIDINGDTQITTDSVFQVGDLQTFTAFVQSLINDEFIRWHVSASASVTPVIIGISLPKYTGIPFEKDIQLGGCNGLLDVKLEVFNMTRSNMTSVNVDLKVAIQNPSIFNILPMGDLHFTLFYNDSRLGEIYSFNQSLYAGSNEVTMTGHLAPDDNEKANEVINRFLTGQDTNVTAVAAADASSIPLYNAGMVGLALRTTLQGNEVPLIASLNFSSISMRPHSAPDDIQVDFQSNLTLELDSPLGTNSPLFINSLDMTANIVYLGMPVASFFVPMENVTNACEEGALVCFSFAVSVDTELTILGDGSAYEKFVADTVNLPAIELRMEGLSNVNARYALGPVTVIGFPVNVTAQLQAFDSFPEVSVQSISITGDRDCAAVKLPPPCGVNAEATAVLMNPSLIGVDLGPGAVQIVYKGAVLGTMQAASGSLTVLPGENIMNLSGFLLPAPGALPEAAEFMTRYLTNEISQISMQGTTLPSYAGSALAMTEQSFELNTAVNGTDYQILGAATLISFGVDFLNYPDRNPQGTGELSVEVSLPPNVVFSYNITAAALNFTMSVYDSVKEDWLPFAALITDYLPVRHVHNSPPQPDLIYLTLVDQPIVVLDDEAFSTFATQLLLDPTVAVLLSGNTFPNVDSSIGSLSLGAIPMVQKVSLAGWNHMTNPDGSSWMNVKELDLLSSDETSAVLTSDMIVTNPTSISITHAGNLTLAVQFRGVFLGYLTVTDFSLVSGDNPFHAVGEYILPAAGSGQAEASEFLSNYMNQIPSTVLALGDGQGQVPAGITNPLLQSAVQQLATNTTVNGVLSRFVCAFGLHVNSHIIQMEIPTEMYINNPFSIQLALLSSNITVFAFDIHNGDNIGTWIEDRHSDPIVNMPKTVTVSPPVNVHLNFAHPVKSFEELWKLLIANQTAPISVSGNIMGFIGGKNGTGIGLTQQVYMYQNEVPGFAIWSGGKQPPVTCN